MIECDCAFTDFSEFNNVRAVGCARPSLPRGGVPGRLPPWRVLGTPCAVPGQQTTVTPRCLCCGGVRRCTDPRPAFGWGQDFDFFRANFDRANLDSGLHILENFLMSF